MKNRFQIGYFIVQLLPPKIIYKFKNKKNDSKRNSKKNATRNFWY